MRLKKNVFGFAMCILYGILLVLLLGTILFVSINKTVIAQGTEELPLYIGMAVMVAVLFCIKFFAGKLAGKGNISKKVKILAEVLIVGAILAVGIYLRLCRLEALTISGENNVFYKMAIVQLNGPAFYLSHNAQQLYGSVLRLILSLLGNEVLVCVYLQIILQCFIIAFVFGIVRNINGSLAALFAAAVIAVAPSFVEATNTLSPELFYLCIYTLTFYLISVVWKHNAEGEYKTFSDIFVFVCVGLLTGVVIFMDVSGITLLVIAVVGIFLSNKQPRTAAFEKPFVKGIFFGVGAVLGAVLLLIGKALSYDMSLKQSFMEYCSVLTSKPMFSLQQVLAGESIVVSTLLILIAAAWIVRYRKADREEAVPYILCLVGAVASTVFLAQSLNYQLLRLTAWVMLAAAGLESLLHQYNFVKETETAVIAEEKKVVEDVEIEEPKPTITLIPNPLPLPKKHVKKEMDYAFIPEEEQMHYDIDNTKDDDDYTI